jgi:hypothetical protein
MALKLREISQNWTNGVDLGLRKEDGRTLEIWGPQIIFGILPNFARICVVCEHTPLNSNMSMKKENCSKRSKLPDYNTSPDWDGPHPRI